MPTGPLIGFADFHLDLVNQRLLRRDVEIPLRAKSLACLRHLVEHAGRLVSREELLRAVWPDVSVSGGVVRTSIAEVREALGDDPLVPRFVETVGRRGYRFLEGSGTEPSQVGTFVGREQELARLHQQLARARERRRGAVFVSGEPGIGKTTLVERFLDEVRAARLGRAVTGQCVELHGPAEPYLPVLDVLERLCRAEGEEVTRVLERWAPSWLLQLPGLVDPDALERLRRRVPVPNRDRMLRELASAFEVLGRDTPLVVVFEDLHWSDTSTVDLLAYVAERTPPACLLLLGTYRAVELVVREHPLRRTARQLIARGRAVEVPLELLGPEQVRGYLERRLGSSVDPALPAWVHARTEGNPLFVVSVVEHLLERGALASEEGCWRLVGAQDASIPQTLRELVVRQLEGLAEDEREVLAAASAMGTGFDVLGVAAGAGRARRDVERLCAGLAEREQLIATAGTTQWPDGSVGGSYEFLHDVHREVLYGRLTPAERGRLHRAIGARLEAGYASRPESVAAVLASHFERGGDWARAVRWHRAAADAAKARLAEREVVAHCEAVIELLPRLPGGDERKRTEMVCALELGASLLAVRGYSAPEVEGLFARARDLACSLELPYVEMMARGGLFTYHVMHGDQRRALELAGDLLAVAERHPNPLFTMIAHTTLGSAHNARGHLKLAHQHFVRARAAWQPGFPRLQLDQKVLFLGIGALVLQQLGEIGVAEAWLRDLLEYAEPLDDPLNTAHAFKLAAEYHCLGGDFPAADVWAERSLAIAEEHGFPGRAALAAAMKGWALGDLDAQRAALDAGAANGHHVGEPLARLAIATTLLDQGMSSEALDELARGFAFVETSGEERHLAELHRVAAACQRAEGRVEVAEAELRRALEVCRAQESRLFELRAVADIVEHLAEAGRELEARELLEPACAGSSPPRELERLRSLRERLG